MRAWVEAAPDVARVKKAIAKIAKANTPEAWGLIFDIAIEPPKLPFECGTSFVAMSAINRAHKRNADVQELIIARCVDADVDADVWEFPLILHASMALANKSRALADKRIVKVLRDTLASKKDELATNAAFVLTRLGDHGALPLIVALLANLTQERVGDRCHRVSRVAEAMQKLRGAKAADFAKLKAARAKVHDPYWDAKLDKQLASLAKRFT